MRKLPLSVLRKRIEKIIKTYVSDEDFDLGMSLERDTIEEARKEAKFISELWETNYEEINHKGYTWIDVFLTEDISIAIHVTNLTEGE